MRISIVNSFFYPKETGGAEVSIRHLAQGFVRAGHQVQVVCLGEEDSREEIDGVSVHRLKLFNGRWHRGFHSTWNPPKVLWHALDSWNPVAGARVAEAVAEFGADVVNANNLSGLSASVLPAIAARHIPILMTLRDYYLTCVRTTRQRTECQTCERQCADCAVFGFPRRMASRSVDHVAGVSRYVVDVHQRDGYFVDTPSSVLPPPIAWPALVVPRTGKAPGCRFGFLGRMVAVKGVALLVDEFARAYETRRDISLLIAGDEGPAEFAAELQARAAGLPVTFLGRTAPADFMAAVDVAVVPSLWAEPAGRVVGEAMSYGVPVIGSGLGGMGEGIDDGQTGWRFDVATPGSLATTLLRAAALTDAEYAAFSARARAASAGRSDDAVVAAHLAIFDQLVRVPAGSMARA